MYYKRAPNTFLTSAIFTAREKLPGCGLGDKFGAVQVKLDPDPCIPSDHATSLYQAVPTTGTVPVRYCRYFHDQTEDCWPGGQSSNRFFKLLPGSMVPAADCQIVLEIRLFAAFNRRRQQSGGRRKATSTVLVWYEKYGICLRFKTLYNRITTSNPWNY